MFTWIPLYEETATALRAYRDRQPELVQILADMAAAGLKATSVEDKAADGSRFTLKEIDLRLHLSSGQKPPERQLPVADSQRPLRPALGSNDR